MHEPVQVAGTSVRGLHYQDLARLFLGERGSVVELVFQEGQAAEAHLVRVRLVREPLRQDQGPSRAPRAHVSGRSVRRLERAAEVDPEAAANAVRNAQESARARSQRDAASQLAPDPRTLPPSSGRMVAEAAGVVREQEVGGGGAGGAQEGAGGAREGVGAVQGTGGPQCGIGITFKMRKDGHYHVKVCGQGCVSACVHARRSRMRVRVHAHVHSPVQTLGSRGRRARTAIWQGWSWGYCGIRGWGANPLARPLAGMSPLHPKP